ncbi:MAG: hypothetical protein ACOCVV_05880 [Marinobacter sp.]
MTRDQDPDTRPGSDRQWWTTNGTEYCFVCENQVHPELLVYCIACDRGLCAWCLNHQDRPLCPSCTAGLAEEEG